MKSTNNSQKTEAVNKSAICASLFTRFAIAATWQSHITEELSDDAQAAFRGGLRWYPNPTPEQSQWAFWMVGG